MSGFWILAEVNFIYDASYEPSIRLCKLFSGYLECGVLRLTQGGDQNDSVNLIGQHQNIGPDWGAVKNDPIKAVHQIRY